MPPTNSTLQNQLHIYRKVLVEEFIREFNFLADVIAGRATAKGDFTDKVFKLITLGTSSALGSVSLPGLNIAAISIEIVINWINETRKAGKYAFMGEQQAEVDQEQLRILLETVAIEASRRYEFIIATYLSDVPTEGVIPLAKAGVERMLEYVARNRLPLNAEHLLNGLMAGHSGAYVSGFRNTRLTSKDTTQKSILTAEGIYGRSAFMTANQHYWVLRDKRNAQHKRPQPQANQTPSSAASSLLEKIGYKKEALFNYGYVKFTKVNRQVTNDPKYGFALVPQKLVDHYYDQFKEAQDINSLSTSLKQVIQTHAFSIQPVQKQDIIHYLTQEKTKQSFTAYMKKRYPQLIQVIYAPENSQDLDLSTYDFSGADMSDCLLNGIKIAGSLVNSQFNNASLIGADLSGVTEAKGANFHHAHLENLNACGANLSYADFTHAQLHFADLTGAKLIHIQPLGAIWIGANLNGIQTQNKQSTDTLQTQQQQQQKALQAQQQQLKDLQAKVLKHQDTLEQMRTIMIALDKTVETFSMQQATANEQQAKKMQEVLAQLTQEKMTRETFTRYCQAELTSLHQKTKAADNKLELHQQLIEQLQQQLKQSQQQQGQIPKLLAGFEHVVTQLQQQSAAQHDLTHTVNELEHQVTHYLLTQREQINQVFAGLTSLQHEVERFKQEVRQELQRQREWQQKAHDAMEARLQAMEVKLQQAALLQHIPVSERQSIFAQQITSLSSQLTALQLGQAAPKPPIDPRHVIPYFQLTFQHKLAEGSFGHVYLGRWCEQDVAIKLLEGHLTAAEEKEFVREVNIMSRLHHPHITQFYGACLEAGRACLVMEYMAQGSLTAVLSTQPFPPEQQKQIALDIARGLLYLHQQKILHRDLKSGNILINEYGRAKISDFGLSKVHYTSVNTLQKVTNDLQWQAPETFQRKQGYTEKSDIYSFGMILWEIVTAKKPYAAIKQIDLPTYILNGQHEAIPESVPKVLADLIRHCWQLNPADRPDMIAIIRELEHYQPRPASPTPEVYCEQGMAFEKQKDYVKALQLYQKSADRGFFRAQTNVGTIFLMGKGMEKPNKQKAYEYFLAAAQQGHLRAMFNLANMLEYGDGIPKDLAQALQWYEKIVAMEPRDKQAQEKVQKLKPLVQADSGPHYRQAQSSFKY